jgi:hypothetical protein
MPELVEKRAVPRYSVTLPFLFKPNAPTPVKSGTGWTHDLSEEGACLELPSRFPKATTIRLVLQTDQGALDLSAVVIWTAMLQEKGEGILHGVTFVNLTPDRRQTLRDLIRAERPADAPS